jgi:hypothetical protein
MVVTLTEEEFQEIKSTVLDADGNEALRILRKFIRRIEQQRQSGMKSHLEG